MKKNMKTQILRICTAKWVHIVSVFGWLLVILPIPVFMFLRYFFCAIDDSFSDVLPVGLLVGVGAQMIAFGNNRRDENQKREGLCLKSFVLAYEQAYDLLQDCNNDRVKWVCAARALANASMLAAEITHDTLRRNLELHRLNYQVAFSNCLQQPAPFFYGAPRHIANLDKAAEWSSKPETRHGVYYASASKSIPEEILRPIWIAMQWTDIFEAESNALRTRLQKQARVTQRPLDVHPDDDPLKNQKFSDGERLQIGTIYPGLLDYLNHKTMYCSVGGKLSIRKN